MKGFLGRIVVLALASLPSRIGAADVKTAFKSSERPAGKPIVLVVDGAGDLKGCSTAILRAAVTCEFQIDLRTFPWSHGHYRLYQDQVDAAHFRAKGKDLAIAITALRLKEPGRPVVLVSHSAGCSVALAACAHLPPDTLERQVLLAPSVSTRYDLRPALRATRQIDVFCSQKDRWALGLVIRWVRSADDLRDGTAAGRHGFDAIADNSEDAALYRRLRHHFWSEADAKLGHDGRHHGMHAPEFVKERIFPLLK